MKGKTSFRGKKRGQVSAELIVLIAAVLAVALVFATMMQETAKQGAQAVKKQAQNVFNKINDTSDIATGATKKAAGESCTKDSQCASGNCEDYLKVCK